MAARLPDPVRGTRDHHELTGLGATLPHSRGTGAGRDVLADAEGGGSRAVPLR